MVEDVLMRSLAGTAAHWVDIGFACYDFAPMRPNEAQRLRDNAFHIAHNALCYGVQPRRAYDHMMDYLDKAYVEFHSHAILVGGRKTRRMLKRPQLVSLKPFGLHVKRQAP